MEFNKTLIENQENLIKKLSKIDLTKNKKEVLETAKNYLQINSENKGGIVSLWLERKKEKFKDYLLNKIIIDPNLPIYYESTIIEGEINNALKALNSFDLVCTNIQKKWIEENMNRFLSVILKDNTSNINREKNGEKEFLEFYNKTYEKYLIFEFIDNFKRIINNILDIKINDSTTRFTSFGFIRRMTDSIYNEDISGLSTNPYFNKRLSNVFSNSRRLIRNLFAFEFIKSLELFPIANIPVCESEKENRIFEYNYKDNNIIIRFKQKEIGINSGFILNIIKYDHPNKKENILNSFYVKKYYGSTKSGSKNFEDKDKETFSISASKSFKASSNSIGKKSEWKKRKFDLKEPFLYTLLNLLNFVPEVKFFINPYTIDGFYIATKNISEQKNRFLSLANISINNNNSNLIKESLNLTDFISRIFRLRDLHNDNFGFVVEQNQNQQVYKSLAIIDFAQPIFMKSYQISPEKLITDFLKCNYSGQKNEGIRILNLDENFLNETDKYMIASFLKVEEKTRILNGFNSLEQFENRIKAVELSQINFSETKRKVFKDEEPDDFIDEKLRYILNINSENIKNLMLEKRGIENKPEEIMLRHPITKKPRINAELIGFIVDKKPDNVDPSIGQLDYLDDAFKDLDNYCQCIMYNYKFLKKFIQDNYNKYLAK